MQAAHQTHQLGKYTLDELIAVGGMAEIYRARTAGLGGIEKMVAIKRLHDHYCSDRDFVEMLVDEARIAMQLSHKNIGQVYELEREGNAYFLTMEYIHGRDLYRVARRFAERSQLMPLEAACYVASEIASGLSYAHRRLDTDGDPLNIIHRDVSPQNVIVSFEGEVKIVDFGIAKAAKRASFTQNGVIKGKFYYMSPEQARGDRIDQRADVFGIGAILYEMVTGRMLYEGEDDARLVHRARRADYKPPSAYSPDIPRQLEQIVLKALARDIHQRFQTARDLQLALTNFMHSMGWSYDSVMLSDQMHILFDQAERVATDAMTAPAAPVAEQFARPSQIDEEAPTEVFGGNEIGAIVDQIDSHYDQQRAGAQPVRRAAPAAPREVDIALDAAQRNKVTHVGRPPVGPTPARSGPPVALILTAIAGIVLLLGAFVFAASQLFSDEETDDRTPKLEGADAAASFTIESEPAGARIFIDGEDTNMFTPATMTDVSAGLREVRLELRHFDPVTQNITIEGGKEWSATLTPRTGVLKIETTPLGAEIHVDGEHVGESPLAIDGQLMAESHLIAASLDGHRDVVKTVHWISDDPILKIAITLPAADAKYGFVLDALLLGVHANVVGALSSHQKATPKPISPPQGVVPPGTTPRTPPTTQKRKTKRKKSSGSSGKSTAAMGRISVASKPPGDVYVDGKPTGRKTPLKSFSVSSGYHKIKVKYPDGSFSGTKRPLIKPGQEVKLFFR